jgi:hypothetical protein
MKQNIKVEAEKGELVIHNKTGDYAIIPTKYRMEVKDMIKDKCFACLDNLVESLPVMEDYAEDGTLIPDLDKVKSTLNTKNSGVTDTIPYNDKLRQFHSMLLQNPSIKGIPEYEVFVSSLNNPDVAKKFHSMLLQNPSVKGIPNDYNIFANQLGYEKKKVGTEGPEISVPDSSEFIEPTAKKIEIDTLGTAGGAVNPTVKSEVATEKEIKEAYAKAAVIVPKNLNTVPDEEIEEVKKSLREQGLSDKAVEEAFYMRMSEDRMQLAKAYLLKEEQKERRLREEIGRDPKTAVNSVMWRAIGDGQKVISKSDKELAEATLTMSMLEGRDNLSKEEFDKLQQARETREKIGAGKTFFNWKTFQTHKEEEMQNVSKEDVFTNEQINEKKYALTKMTESQLGKAYLESWAEMNALRELLNTGEKTVTKTLPVDPQLLASPTIDVKEYTPEGQKINNQYKDAILTFKAASELLLLNKSPEEIKKGFGLLGATFLTNALTPILGEEVIKEFQAGIDGFKNDRLRLDFIEKFASEKGVQLTDAEQEKGKRLWIEDAFEMGGGLVGFMTLMYPINAPLKLAGIPQAIAAMRTSGSALKRFGSVMIEAQLEEIKFQAVGGGTGMGAGLILGSRIIPNIKFGRTPIGLAIEPYANAVLKTSLGATTGMELGHAFEVTIDALMEDKDLKYRLDEAGFGDLSEFGRRVSVELVTNGMLGLAHIKSAKEAVRQRERYRMLREEMEKYSKYELDVELIQKREQELAEMERVFVDEALSVKKESKEREIKEVKEQEGKDIKVKKEQEFSEFGDYIEKNPVVNKATEVENRMRNAEEINVKETEAIKDEILKEIDRVEKSDMTKENKNNIIDSLSETYDKIDDYEFTTETKTKKVIDREPVEVRKKSPRTKAVKEKPTEERIAGKKAEFEGGLRGTIEIVERPDGKRYAIISRPEKGVETKKQEAEPVEYRQVVDENGKIMYEEIRPNVPAVKGTKGKVAKETTGLLGEAEKIDLASTEINYNKDGYPVSLTGKTKEGKQYTIRDMELAVEELMNRARKEELSKPEFETIIKEIEREVTEEVLIDKPKKDVKKEQVKEAELKVPEVGKDVPRGKEKVSEKLPEPKEKLTEPVKEGNKVEGDKKVGRERIKGDKIVVDSYTELKRSLRDRAKAANAGAREATRSIKETRDQFVKWVKENEKDINRLSARLTPAILRRVNGINSDKSLQKAIDYIDRVLADKEYLNTVTEANKYRKFVKAKAKLRKGVNVFGDKYELAQNALKVKPEDLTAEELNVYHDYIKKAAKALKENSKVPDIEPIEKIYNDFMHRIEVESADVRTAKTFEKLNKALEKLEEIENIEDIETYLSVKRKPAEIEAQATRLLREGEITEKEYNDIRKKVDELLDKERVLDEDMLPSLREQAAEYKNQVIDRLREKAKERLRKLKNGELEEYAPQKDQKIRDFLSIPDRVLREMSIKDIDTINRIIDAIDSGVVPSSMYNLVTKAESVQWTNKLTHYFNRYGKTKKFQELKKSINKLRVKVVTKQTFRMDEDIFGSNERVIKEAVSVLDEAIVTTKVEKTKILYDFLNARKQLRRFKRGKNMDNLNDRIGIIYTIRDWMSNKVKDNNGVEYEWIDAPTEIKNKFDSIFDRIFKDKDYPIELSDLTRLQDIWKELKKYETDGVFDWETALSDLKRDKKVKNYIDAIDKVFSELDGYAEVATENRGRPYVRRNNYFPAFSKEKAMGSTADDILLKDVDSIIGKFTGNRVSLEAGSTFERTNKAYLSETNIDKVIMRAVDSILSDYYVTPKMRSIMAGFRDAGKNTKNKSFTDILNDDLANRIKFALNREEIENAEKYFRRVMRYSKWMLLSRPDRPVNEYLFNGLRGFMTEGILPTDYKYALNPVYKELIRSSVSDTKFSQYQEEIGSESLDSNVMKRATRGLVTFADTQIGRLVFTKVFRREFKNMTNEKFNEEKFVTDVEYREKYKEVINKSRVDAISRVEELFNSKAPLSAPLSISLFGKEFRKNNSLVDMIYFMQSFNHNELNQVATSIQRIYSGSTREKVMGARDISAIIATNYGYMQGVMFMNAIYKSLIADLVDDDNKSEIEDALKEFYDKQYNGEKVITSISGSVINLSTGKYGNLLRATVPHLLAMVEDVGKKNNYSNQEWYQNSVEEMKNLLETAYFIKPIKKYGRWDTHINNTLPGIGLVLSKFAEAGWNLTKIAQTPREKLKSDEELYIYDLIHLTNLIMSMYYMNPGSPIVDKLSQYAIRERNSGDSGKYGSGIKVKAE